MAGAVRLLPLTLVGCTLQQAPPVLGWDPATRRGVEPRRRSRRRLERRGSELL